MLKIKRKVFHFLVVMAVILVVGTMLNFAGKARDCENCGTNCQAGSCDDSLWCVQCVIGGCLMGDGSRKDINCNPQQP